MANPIGSTCALLLDDLFLFSYKSEFLQTLVETRNSKNPDNLISLSDIYIDDVLSINSAHVLEWVLLIYPSDLNLKKQQTQLPLPLFLNLYLTFDIIDLLQNFEFFEKLRFFLSQEQITLVVFGTTFWNFGSSTLFNFVLVWIFNYFDLSVTDESYVDEL